MKIIVDFNIELVRDEKDMGYTASFVDYPIIAEGDTKEEAIQNLKYTFLVALQDMFG